MLKIYGSDLSAPANALGLKYEYIRVNLREKEHLRPEFKPLHPANKIPVIDDEGFILFESGAIVKYLAEKNNSAPYPKITAWRGRLRQEAFYTQCHREYGEALKPAGERK